MKQRRILNLFPSSYLVMLMLLGTCKSSPILSDNRISLQCQHDCMLLELDLQDIPKLKPTSLHLRQFSCRPHKVTNTRAIFRVPFQGCGTTRGTDSNHIVYQNVVGNSQEFNETRVVVRHVPELYYPFACRYRQKYTLTLKDGEMKEQTKESGHRKANSTREDFPQDEAGPTSSVRRAHLHFLGLLLLVIHVWL